MRRLLLGLAGVFLALQGLVAQEEKEPSITARMWHAWEDSVFLPGYAFPFRPLVIGNFLWTDHYDSWGRYLDFFLLPAPQPFSRDDSIYTVLAYFQGARELQYFDARHEQRRKQGGFFFHYRRLYTAGYYAHRTTRLRLGQGGGMFRRSGYAGRVHVQWKDAAWEENGGVAAPELLSEVTPFQYPGLPVRLAEASQEVRHARLTWQGRWQRRRSSDSDSVMVRAPWGLTHAFWAGDATYRYADPGATAGSGYYRHVDSLTAADDSVASSYFYGKIGVFYHPQPADWHLEGGMEIEGGSTRQPSQAVQGASAVNAYFQGAWQRRSWLFSADMALKRLRQINGILEIRYRPLRWAFALSVERRILFPFQWMALPGSPYYPEGSGFSEDIPLVQARAAFQWKGLSIRGRVGRIGPFPQWDTALQLRVRPAVPFARMTLSGRARWGRWHGGGAFVVQQVDTPWWGVPSLIIKMDGGVAWRWLKRVQSTFRVRLFWHASYAAPRFYAPRLMWLGPSQDLLSNPPWIQVELTGRVRTFHAFVRAEHVLFLITGTPFRIDYYNPMSPFRITWGVQWAFHD